MTVTARLSCASHAMHSCLSPARMLTTSGWSLKRFPTSLICGSTVVVAGMDFVLPGTPAASTADRLVVASPRETLVTLRVSLAEGGSLSSLTPEKIIGWASMHQVDLEQSTSTLACPDAWTFTTRDE
eukprot:4694543-Amphidinium_carterae.1